MDVNPEIRLWPDTITDDELIAEYELRLEKARKVQIAVNNEVFSPNAESAQKVVACATIIALIVLYLPMIHGKFAVFITPTTELVMFFAVLAGIWSMFMGILLQRQRTRKIMETCHPKECAFLNKRC